MNFDVVGVDFTTHTVRFVAKDKTLDNAYAVVQMDVLRRAMDKEFFAVVPKDSYKEGDAWTGIKMPREHT